MGVRNKIRLEDGTVPIPTKGELLDKINTLERVKDRALVAFLYLTGARISEVCRFVYNNAAGERVNRGSPIQKKQISQVDGILYVERVRSLKKKKGMRIRTIPIMISREKEFVKLFAEYFNNIFDPEAYLFPMTRQNAYVILSRIGLYPHYLRHIRLTHLTTEYGFKQAELQRFCNWTTSKMADNYVHLIVDDLVDRMKQTAPKQDQEQISVEKPIVPKEIEVSF